MAYSVLAAFLISLTVSETISPSTDTYVTFVWSFSMRTTAVCSSVSAVISIYRLSTPSASETLQKLASSNVPSHLRSSSVADSNTSSSRSG